MGQDRPVSTASIKMVGDARRRSLGGRPFPVRRWRVKEEDSFVKLVVLFIPPDSSLRVAHSRPWGDRGRGRRPGEQPPCLQARDERLNLEEPFVEGEDETPHLGDVLREGLESAIDLVAKRVGDELAPVEQLRAIVFEGWNRDAILWVTASPEADHDLASDLLLAREDETAELATGDLVVAPAQRPSDLPKGHRTRQFSLRYR